MRSLLRSVVVAAALGAGVAAFPTAASADIACSGDDVTVTAANQAQVEAALVCLTNVWRSQNGVLAPLRLDTRLAASARGHSGDMVARGYFEHNSPDPPPNNSPSYRAMNAGYPGGAGENIAFNQGGCGGTAWSLFNQLRNSPGHNANMLDVTYVALGIGVAQDGDPGIMGTQNFGSFPANSADTAVGLKIGAIPAGDPKAGQTCAMPKTTTSTATKAKKCKRKKRRHGRRKRCKKKT